MFIAMNRFKVRKGEEAAFETRWRERDRRRCGNRPLCPTVYLPQRSGGASAIRFNQPRSRRCMRAGDEAAF
jgi:hypothetical protein